MAYELGSDILKLAELLKSNDENKSTSEHEVDKLECQKHSDLISKHRTSKNVQNETNHSPLTLEEFEMQQEMEYNESSDNKKLPQYNIKYRQAVTAEDVFLQMGPKTTSSACCEDMIITIDLPGEKFSAMNLDLTKTDLKLDGFIYKLNLSFPHQVNPDSSNAKWDQSNETLILTLKLCREFDFVNF